MKKLTYLIAILLMIGSTTVIAQQPGTPAYKAAKKSGQLQQPVQVPAPIGPIPTITADASSKEAGGFYVERDGSFTYAAMNPNDDDSEYISDIGFPFCFYGTNYSSLYINNNGNVSFSEAYDSYSPTGFPSPDYVMIAPFWGDVDTEGGCGAVYYKIETNPTRIIVIWEEVGYFYEACDKLNTFQLIMTDGNDPTIGIGKNVAFAYKDMQWTTGDASDGVGGFGGFPATVGINKGDGTTYALVGRFDHPGTDYVGAGGISGVDWLDNQRFAFDGCAGIIPPPPSDVPVSNWAIIIGILLIGTFIFIRFRRLG